MNRLCPRVQRLSTVLKAGALIAVGIGCLLQLNRQALAADKPEAKQLWLYYPTNLLVDENVEKLEAIFRRAAAAGYSHVNITDSKFSTLDTMPPEYFRNVERVKRLAAKLHLELVPGLFPLGWSNALLFHDPNLAAGLPVRDALFVVHDGEARLVADPPVGLPGSFANLKQWGYHDDSAKSEGAAVRMANLKSPVCRVVQTVKVAPFRQYRITVRIKTKDFHGTPEIKVLANDHGLNFNDLDVKPTQDWGTFTTVFNSLENNEANIYFGCWNGGAGSLWYSDPHLEEVGLLNVLRRPGSPVKVTKEQGGEKTAAVEGRDFEKIVDPHMGNIPYAGNYDLSHEPPPIRTKLPDGARLRVSYYHPMVIYGGSVIIALSEPKTMALLRDTAQRLHKAFGAKAYFMEHDEMRLFNWDAADQARHLDAGPLLAEHIRACTKILQETNPGGQIYAWSDMYDPYHNAVKDYYLVRGNIAGSWLGLDPSVTVANWNEGKRDESLPWFAKLGHKQIIAGYYDSPVENVRGWLDSAMKVKGVEGVMYTTWQGDYKNIERFAEVVKAHPWWKQGQAEAGR